MAVECDPEESVDEDVSVPTGAEISPPVSPPPGNTARNAARSDEEQHDRPQSTSLSVLLCVWPPVRHIIAANTLADLRQEARMGTAADFEQQVRGRREAGLEGLLAAAVTSGLQPPGCTRISRPHRRVQQRGPPNLQ
eukprot:3750605-Prymnesium_polylepis.1